MKATFTRFAVLAIGTFCSISAVQANEGLYYYYYAGERQEFHQLADLLEDADNHPGLWRYLRLVPQSAHFSQTDNTWQMQMQIPETQPLLPAGVVYYHSAYCGFGECDSLQEVYDQIEQGIASNGWCMVEPPRVEGEAVFDGWLGRLPGIDAVGNKSYLGQTVTYKIQYRSDCTGDIDTANQQLGLLEPHDCPEGYLVDIASDGQSATCRASLEVPIYTPIIQTCDDTPTSGNPCGVLTGNKTETETDYAATTLSFSRSYNSAMQDSGGTLGQGWRHAFDRKLIVKTIGSSVFPMFYVDRSGAIVRLVNQGALGYVLVSRPGQHLVWDAATATWVLHDGSRREVFSAMGQLQRLVESGRTTHLEYDVAGFLVRVTDHFGTELDFEYADNLLTAVIRPDGERITYEYEERRLVGANYPDGTSRIYHYENGTFPSHLTGITDESGERFSTFAYDGAGMVWSSEHAGGVEKVAIHRHDDGTTTVADPLEHVSTYIYSSFLNTMKLASVDTSCATCTNTDQAKTYDGNGYVKSRTGFDGSVTEYQRDSAGRELLRTEAAGTPEARTIATQWHAALGLPTKITEPGRITDYTYDVNGNRLSETVTDTATGEVRTTAWTYNVNGQVLTVDGPRADITDVTAYTYDAQGNLATATNALGHLTQYTAYDAHGNPLEIVDPNGVVTKLAYDLRQRLINRTVAFGTPAAATTTFDYDPVGQLVKTTLPDGSFIEYEYDAAHRMTAIEDSAGNRIVYTLDAMGNRVEEKVSGPDGVSFRETLRTYNELNRLVSESGPAGSSVSYGYDTEGKRTSVTDAAGNISVSHYDALDRLFQSVDALSGVATYDYDARDNLVQVVDPRGVTTDYTYNGFNELVETDSPDAGVTVYAYDAAGNRVSQTDARGVTATFDYDVLNRLTFIDYPGADQDIGYEYDGTPNAIGRLTAIVDETGRTEYAYDARGNLVSKAVQIDGVWLPLSYAFDAADRIVRITYPDNTEIRYQRDAHGRIDAVLRIAPDGTQSTLLDGIQHAPFGPVTVLDYGNGLAESRSFDAEGRISRILLPLPLGGEGGGEGGILDLAYTWDANGNITAIANNLDAARSQAFAYDALYRLTNADGVYGNLQWSYDAVGNRLSQTATPPGSVEVQTTTYTYAPDANRLIGLAVGDSDTVTYTYDANGNILDNGAHGFDYDARNRLVTADGVNHYAHNALGQRAVKHTPVTTPPGSGEPDPDVLEQIAELEAQAQATLNDAADEQQAAQQAFATAAVHQQQADAHAADAAQNRLEAQQNWAAYEENLADIAEAQAEITEMQEEIEDLQDDLIEPALTPEDNAHNAPILSEIASLEAEIEEEQLDIADDTADAEEDQADALDDEADAEEAEALAAQSQVLANQHTQEGNAHLATAAQLTQQAADLQAQADALRNSAPTEPQGGTILFAYDEAGHLLGEYNATGNPIRQYVWLEDRPVAMLVPDTATGDQIAYYIHVNNINAPQVLTDENGQVVWQADYQPFGEAEEVVSNIEFNLRLPGQYRDHESSLHYNYFRSYDPGTGRYGQNDPIGLSGGLNRYAYVKANPISRFDQYGLFDAVNPADYPNLDPGDGGVFCDGRGGFRVWVPNDWDECIRDCVVQHENMHLNHIYTKNQQSICSSKTADHRIVASTQEERLWTERIAYQTEKRCLQRKLDAIECGDACENRIRNRILFVDGKLNQEDF